MHFARVVLRLLRLGACSLLLVGGVALAQDAAIPPLTAHVVDTANALTVAERAEVDARLAVIEQKTGSQVAVLVVPTTKPEDIAAYGIRVADAWKVGRKSVDDGVILIVAMQDHKLRIEVGRGLEGAIPDAVAKRIIDETIAPAFKRGDVHAGIAAGIERIAERVGTEALPAPAKKSQNSGGISGLLWPILVFVFFLLSIFGRGSRQGFYTSRGGAASQIAQAVILGALAGRGGRGGGGGTGGGWSGGGGGGFGGGGASGGW